MKRFFLVISAWFGLGPAAAKVDQLDLNSLRIFRSVSVKGKFAALLIGITFAVFHMVMMTTMFFAILNRSASLSIIWVPRFGVLDPEIYLNYD